MKDKCDDSTSGTAVQLCPDEPAVIAVFMGISWVSMTGLPGFNGDFIGNTHVLMGMMDDQLLINQQTRVFPKIFGQTHVFNDWGSMTGHPWSLISALEEHTKIFWRCISNTICG